MRRSIATLAPAALVYSLAACHHGRHTTLASDPAHSPACIDEIARERDTAIHIDGPYMNLPQRGDSVVIVVNDREEWRGVYDPCAHDFPLRRGTPNGTERAAAATDAVTSLEIVHGRDAATRFGIGTAHAVAYVIRATPRRH